MSSKTKKYIFSFIFIFQNFLYFLIFLINYNSTKGTDYEKYSTLLNYFTTNQTGLAGLESGLSYFWFISLFFHLFKSPLKYSNDPVEYILTFSIQLSNFLLFLIGLIGIYFLLKKVFNYSKNEILPLLIILSLFPPIIGARIILKPEIMVFALFPWLLLFYYEYFKKKNTVYLFYSIPIVSILMTLKVSISFILAISLLVIFNKNIFQLQFLTINLISLLIFGFLIYENYLINGNYLWEHVSPQSYRSKADMSYIYNIDFKELWNNPYRDSFKNSMLGIILADTFGDYWQRYWFHYEGWGLKINGNTVSKNFPGNINTIRFSIFASIFFYISTIIFLIKEKNNMLFNFGILGFLGLLALIINALNLLGTEQFFDSSKGDPMKTHLFSFVLIFTFLYFLIKLKAHKNIYIFSTFFLVLNFFLMTMLNPISISEIINTQHLISKIYHFGPCQLTLFVDSVLSSNISECGGDNILDSNNSYFYRTQRRILVNNVVLVLSFLGIIHYYLKQKSNIK